MPGAGQTVDIGRVIELAVAPVFLMTALGAFLAVLTSRMARIIDRSRSLEAELDGPIEQPGTSAREELRILVRRARLVNRSISLCTLCALLVCGVIITLFVGAFFARDLSVLIGMLFIAAMLSLSAGLVSFLQEIVLATRHLRVAFKDS